MTRKTLIVTLIVLATVAVSFSYLRSLARRVFHEAPLVDAAARAQLAQEALQPSSGLKQTVTLYFPSYEQAKLIPEAREMAWATSDPDRIRQVVLALIQGPREGAGRALPPSADVRAVFLTADGTAYLDFSNDLRTGFAPGIESETLAAYSIVDSVTANVPAVKRVKILLQGQEAETWDGHADLSDTYVADPDLIQSPGSPPPPSQPAAAAPVSGGGSLKP